MLSAGFTRRAYFFLPVRTVWVTVVFGLRFVVAFVTKRPETAERFTLRVPILFSPPLACRAPAINKRDRLAPSGGGSDQCHRPTPLA
jgi:hypothetical protein